MKTIWKFQLLNEKRVHISVPVGTRILSAGYQAGHVCVWGIVDSTAPTLEAREIAVVWTGGDAPSEPFNFLGTIVLGADEGFVLHVFEILKA